MKILRSRIRFLAVVLTLLFVLILIAGTGTILREKNTENALSSPDAVESPSPSPDTVLTAPSDEPPSLSPEEPEFDTFGL